jgi:thiamine-monophosphate kinase
MTPRPHQTLGPGKEFDTIRMLMSRWGSLAVDIGDDAAVLAVTGGGARVISTDAFVEDAHFQRAWISAFEVGARATAAALSDLAAMGATADALLVAMVVPDEWRERLGDVADGIAEVVRDSGARIVGGNLARGREFSITTTVVGSARTPIARRGAQPGDVLCVTGQLGGPASAIRAWTRAVEPDQWSRTRFARPMPRLREGAALAAAGAHAMLDISDGLVADARHLAAASGVCLTIDATRVPRGPLVDVATALSSGEEYELLVALAPSDAERLLRTWSSQFDVPLTVIGAVDVAGPDGGERAQSNAEPGAERDLVRVLGAVDENSRSDSPGRVEFVTGHDHFTQ